MPPRTVHRGTARTPPSAALGSRSPLHPVTFQNNEDRMTKHWSPFSAARYGLKRGQARFGAVLCVNLRPSMLPARPAHIVTTAFPADKAAGQSGAMGTSAMSDSWFQAPALPWRRHEPQVGWSRAPFRFGRALAAVVG
jgi:hypothetical protein